jgi:formamidopyrimidine-DNA glycosylase
MPEGPEVESVRLSLVPTVVGARIESAWVSSLSLRTPVSAADFAPVLGQVVIDIGRRGKLLWLSMGEIGVFIRLGMTGRARLHDPNDAVEAHTHVRLSLIHNAHRVELRYIDPRRFGEVVPYHPLQFTTTCAAIGPDGITLADHEVDGLAASLRRTQRELKTAILDQQWLGGVGNIYACEALFRAGLSPWRKGSSLSLSEARTLVVACRQALQHGLLHGGTSFSDYVNAQGATGGALEHLFVFQRETHPCKSCSGVIERATQAGRSTFFCRRCQHARPARTATS